jgi:protein farnesyltransferase/geranylgeranyltransferase type-1 subunit alpha
VARLTVRRYTKEAIFLAPQNASPWNYLRGLARQAKGPAAIALPSLKEFAQQYASVDTPDSVRSSHALDLLADIYAEEQKSEDAGKALDLLASKYDPIRANYWLWRKEKLGLPAVTASA